MKKPCAWQGFFNQNLKIIWFLQLLVFHVSEYLNHVVDLIQLVQALALMDIQQFWFSGMQSRHEQTKAYQALDDEEEAFQIYQDLATDLSENPEFLHDYAYILREFGYRDQARATAEKYHALVPDDVNMQTFFVDY